MPPWVMTYRWFAKIYGFTPDQVDELPIEVVMWWPEIEDAEATVAERKQRQEMQRSRNSHGSY